MESRQGGGGETGNGPALPQVCPYCKEVPQTKTFVNGTLELRCVKTTKLNQYEPHSFTFYVKPR